MLDRADFTQWLEPKSQQSWVRSTTYINIQVYKYHSVCHLVVIGTTPPPLPPASEPPPGTKGGVGAHTHLQVRGWGSPTSDDWRKSLELCLLCG
jgi:hypothetical protein